MYHFYFPKLTVKPEIERHSAFAKAAANESATARLVCKAKGGREVSFSWRRKNIQLQAGAKYEIVQRRLENSFFHWESELFISDVRTSDYANYTCVAHNDLGSDHVQVLLTTIGKLNNFNYFETRVIIQPKDIQCHRIPHRIYLTVILVYMFKGMSEFPINTNKLPVGRADAPSIHFCCSNDRSFDNKDRIPLQLVSVANNSSQLGSHQRICSKYSV